MTITRTFAFGARDLVLPFIWPFLPGGGAWFAARRSLVHTPHRPIGIHAA